MKILSSFKILLYKKQKIKKLNTKIKYFFDEKNLAKKKPKIISQNNMPTRPYSATIIVNDDISICIGSMESQGSIEYICEKQPGPAPKKPPNKNANILMKPLLGVNFSALNSGGDKNSENL